jgi:hypothetical protein
MARHYNPQDFRGSELRNFKVHIYPDMTAANAAVATATARIIYVVSEGKYYGGIPGAWVSLGNPYNEAPDILTLTPRVDDPGAPTDGQIWLNGTDGKLRCRIGGVTVDLN